MSSGGRQLRRGDVWWAELDPTEGGEIGKRRPCLIVSADAVNAKRLTIVAVPLTTSIRAIPPFAVRILSIGDHSSAVLDQIRAVSRDRLLSRAGAISLEELYEVENGLRFILGLIG